MIASGIDEKLEDVHWNLAGSDLSCHSKHSWSHGTSKRERKREKNLDQVWMFVSSPTYVQQNLH
jgi:hypothetical protein